MSLWWRDHADHHMGVLLSADGPFKGCKPVTGGHAANKLKVLPCEPPPERGSSTTSIGALSATHGPVLLCGGLMGTCPAGGAALEGKVPAVVKRLAASSTTASTCRRSLRGVVVDGLRIMRQRGGTELTSFHCFPFDFDFMRGC